ncbi:MAG TPA: 50S ribosomal protein L13 [Acholeplasmataceae bacterium]|jgi:large subunit ribosomal protein L13|nr:50S ribosomal protein L13 [Acholeplasmataceae bacterium]
MNTYMAKNETVEHQWFVVDATDKTLGRLATVVASVLKGKHKPTYTPHVDTGDYVIIINAEKIQLTGKKWDQKLYYKHSGYNGGLTSRTARETMDKFPTRMVEKAVQGMLPHTKLGRAQAKKLFVYAGSEHKHSAQQPKELEV